MSDAPQGPGGQLQSSLPPRGHARPVPWWPALVAVVAIAAVVGGVIFATRGGGNSTSAAGSPGVGVASSGPGKPEDALERDIRLLADGRAAEAYQDVIPVERAFISQDLYVKCISTNAGGLEIKSIAIKHIADETIVIPGTDQHADSKAITAELDLGPIRGKQTDTYHEVLMDGRWTFTVLAADAMKAGNCS